MVFQQFNLFNNMDVMKNLTVAPMRIKKMPKDEAESKAIELLKRSVLQTASRPTPASSPAARSRESRLCVPS